MAHARDLNIRQSLGTNSALQKLDTLASRFFFYKNRKGHNCKSQESEGPHVSGYTVMWDETSKWNQADLEWERRVESNVLTPKGKFTPTTPEQQGGCTWRTVKYHKNKLKYITLQVMAVQVMCCVFFLIQNDWINPVMCC